LIYACENNNMDMVKLLIEYSTKKKIL